MDELITELLTEEAIRPIFPEQALFVSNLFLVAKKGTVKRRPVINLKRLNEYIPDQKFKMEGWMEVSLGIPGLHSERRQVVSRGDAASDVLGLCHRFGDDAALGPLRMARQR